MKRSLLLLCVCATALTGASSCGLRGRLDRPVPLWGDPPNEGPRDPRAVKAEKERVAAEKAQKKAEQEAARAAQEGAATPPTDPGAIAPRP